MTKPPFLRRTAQGVTIELRVQPRARRTMLEPSADTLKAAVTSPPEDGKANDAVIELIAGEWRLPRSTISVLKGAASRKKVLALAGDPDLLSERIAAWMKRHG